MTVTKTVFIGAVAIIATAFHGCGNKEEENQNSDETQSTETDEQEKALKARQRDTENVVQINLQHLEEIEALKAKNQALEKAANACRAGGECCDGGACRSGGACSGGNTGDEDVEFAEADARYKKAVKQFLQLKSKKSEADLNEDEVEELAEYLQFEVEEDFDDHIATRKEKGLQNAEMLSEAFEQLADIEGDDQKAKKVMERILQPFADIKKKPVEELSPDDLTEEDLSEIAFKLEDHFMKFDRENLQKARSELADQIEEAGAKNKKYNKIMKEQNLDDLDSDELQGVAAQLTKEGDLEAPLKAAAKKQTDRGQKALLDKVAAMVAADSPEEEDIEASLEDFKAYAAEKFSGTPFDSLTSEQIQELAADLGKTEKMLELERAFDDDSGEAPEPFTQAVKEVKQAAKSDPNKTTLKKQVQEHEQAMQAAAAGETARKQKKASKKQVGSMTPGA